MKKKKGVQTVVEPQPEHVPAEKVKLTREAVEGKMQLAKLNFDSCIQELNEKKRQHQDYIQQAETRIVQLQGEYEAMRNILESYSW